MSCEEFCIVEVSRTTPQTKPPLSKKTMKSKKKKKKSKGFTASLAFHLLFTTACSLLVLSYVTNMVSAALVAPKGSSVELSYQSPPGTERHVVSNTPPGHQHHLDVLDDKAGDDNNSNMKVGLASDKSSEDSTISAYHTCLANIPLLSQPGRPW